MTSDVTDPKRAAASPRLTRSQYRLRTLLILFTLIAVLLGCVGWHLQQMRLQDRAVDAIVRAGGHVIYDPRELADKQFFQLRSGLPQLKYRLGLLPPKFVVLSGKQFDDVFLRQHILQLKHLRGIDLIDVAITKDGLAQLGALRQLEKIGRYESQNIGVHNLRDRKVDLYLTEVAVFQALETISGKADVPIFFDRKDVPGDLLLRPITIHRNQINVQSALNQILAPNNLDWTVGNGGFVVMTRESASSRKHTAVSRQLMEAIPSLRVFQIDASVRDAVRLVPEINRIDHCSF